MCAPAVAARLSKSAQGTVAGVVRYEKSTGRFHAQLILTLSVEPLTLPVGHLGKRELPTHLPEALSVTALSPGQQDACCKMSGIFGEPSILGSLVLHFMSPS